MMLTSIGDLARGFALKRQSVVLRQALTRLGSEVSSGRAADPVAHLGGHLAGLAQIEHDLVLAASYRDGAQEARIAAETMQISLDRIATGSDRLIHTLALSGADAGHTGLSVAAAEAAAEFEGFVSALDVGVAGRHLFSGTAVDTAPLAPAGDILAQLGVAIAAARTPAEVMAAADAFFDTPGGAFEALVYRGAAQSLAPAELGAGETADLGLRADHEAFRATLKHTALAALADDPALALSDEARHGVLGLALDGMLGARDAQAALQAGLGSVEGRIARAGARLEAETAALEMARGALIAVDPYEAATELEAVRLQLETVYSVTARLSRLNLVNFLS
ncbi:MAG: flagellin [Roseovarius sp.]|nr:flagellin [Roseovarius sp.]